MNPNFRSWHQLPAKISQALFRRLPGRGWLLLHENVLRYGSLLSSVVTPQVRQLLLATVLFSFLFGVSQAASPPAILIHLDDNGRVVVRAILDDHIKIGADRRGLVIWSDGDRERWQFFTTEWMRPRGAGTKILEFDLGSHSRGSVSHTANSLDLLQSTTLLAQLLSPSVTKGPGGIVTPHEGAVVLDPQVTFRREAADENTKLASVEAIVRRGDVELFRVQFPENATKIKLTEVPNLPGKLKEGLPPGSYQLELLTPTGIERASFTVADATVGDRVLTNTRALAAMLPAESPLSVQVTVEQFLAHRPPLLTDAMDWLERLPEPKLTKRLKTLKKHVAERLKDPAQRPGSAQPPGDPTGDKVIDKIRALIAASAWEEALEELDSLESDGSAEGQRRQALAQLYRGVILGESGPGRDDESGAAFRDAINGLTKLKNVTSDLQRAHNNYANFLLGRAQDRLHNHAFQMAAGVRHPLLSALDNWIEAHEHYEQALNLAADSDQNASVQLNLARQYALLADIVRTLGHPTDESQRLPDVVEGTSQRAHMLAEEAARSADASDPHIQGVIAELLAQLDYRSGQLNQSMKHAELALGHYVEAGALTGIESTHRLLGLCRRAATDNTARHEALGHFLVSEQLSQILRERFPIDQFGLSRSGFFARRTYVTEHIIELLTAEGRDAEALAYAERSKARALQETLAVRNLSTTEDASTTLDVLSDWPQDTSALEYFLGSQRCWLFVVDHSGKTKAQTLKDKEGQPISAPELIFRVRKFLSRENPNGIDHYKDKLRARLKRIGFDKEWQHELAWFREVLLPDEVLAKVKHARTAVIVPHHILHYFPYAALVTERDVRDLGKYAVPKPHFLIDESVDIVYCPSLAIWRRTQLQPQPTLTRAAAAGIVNCPGFLPLPGVAADLESARRHLGATLLTVLAEDEATKPGVSALLKEKGLLLLAMHGKNDPDQPLQSRLFLYPSKFGSYEPLTAEEIYGRKVATDLVIMSACYSGLADRSPMPGDDLFGIQRALLSSGAKTVVSGLWDVNDGTAPELIGGFHERLAKGEPAASALANSQRAFLAKYRSNGEEAEPYLHPYFWAVYVVTGDHRTTLDSSK